MAEYVLVENGVITEYHGALPQNWRNISGLYLLKDDVPSLISLGWYPVKKVWVNYNSETERVTTHSYQIEEQWVTETPVVEPVPEGEIRTFEQKKSEFLDQLRNMRNDRLRDSDWTQLADCALSAEQQQQWRAYRQALRDLPAIYQDNQVVAIEDITWPTV
jgi:hypothetical protein